MRVLFKGKDPRAGRELDLTPAAAKRYISDGLAEEVKLGKREAAGDGTAPAPTPAPAAAPAPAGKKAAGRGH